MLSSREQPKGCGAKDHQQIRGQQDHQHQQQPALAGAGLFCIPHVGTPDKFGDKKVLKPLIVRVP